MLSVACVEETPRITAVFCWAIIVLDALPVMVNAVVAPPTERTVDAAVHVEEVM